LRDRYKTNPDKEKARTSAYSKQPEVRLRNAERLRQRRKENPERFREYDATKRLKIVSDPVSLTKERQRQRVKQKRAYEKDPEKFKERRRQWYAVEDNANYSRQYCTEYKRNHPDVIRNLNLKHNGKDRAARKKRLPAWLTQEDFNQMKKIYEQAKTLGLHVDHIIPLQGKNVSGLHVPSNLQLLSQAENCAKKNRYEVEL
jgi:hypothetical protein